uniref:B box-type domain-containing protein n=1 Tax=Sinocyclocheilus anshuiensis TaxID=1608454 RepID=A0A671RRS2_9TELE
LTPVLLQLCSLHQEKLDFFCLEDKQPVCLVCRDSQKHINHTFKPISEAVSSYKVKQHGSLDLSVCLSFVFLSILDQRQIKQQFEKLHQFLRDEEEATITALREEEEQKKQMIEKLNRDISALSHTIKYMEEMMKATVDCVSSAPVILDPNTAHPDLILSDDLTSVGYRIHCGGFNSGTHCWDVEVKGCSWWSVGVTTASNQRKGRDFFNADVWSVQCRLPEKSMNEFPVEQCLDRVRVYLDCDRGTVSFSDPVTNTHLHTFTTTFTDTVLPFFHTCWSGSSCFHRVSNIRCTF